MFDTLMVFLKDLFLKMLIFRKKSSDSEKSCKITQHAKSPRKKICLGEKTCKNIWQKYDRFNIMTIMFPLNFNLCANCAILSWIYLNLYEFI